MRRAKEGEGLEDFHHVMRGTVDVTGKLQITSGSILARGLAGDRSVPVLQGQRLWRAADRECSPRGPFLELSMNVSHVSEWEREFVQDLRMGRTNEILRSAADVARWFRHS